MKNLFVGFFAIIFCGCAPKVFTEIINVRAPSDFSTDVLVIGLSESAPEGALEIGTLKIFDTGFSTNCKWDAVIARAKIEAIKAGGNALKITSHFPATTFGSTCDRIIATILKIENIDQVKLTDRNNIESAIDSSWNYAKLYVMRSGGTGFLVGYDLYLGDSVICRVKANSAQEIKITKKGYNSLWAKTESKEEIPIEIEFGKEYFLKCSMVTGIMVARPMLQIVDSKQGKNEFNYIISRK